jgi:hypothetical protein
VAPWPEHAGVLNNSAEMTALYLESLERLWASSLPLALVAADDDENENTAR